MFILKCNPNFTVHVHSMCEI